MPPPGLRGGMFPPGGLRGGGRPTLFEDRSPYPLRMGGPHGMGGYPGMGGPAGMSGPSGMGGPAGYGRGGMGGSFRGGPGMMRPMGPSGGGYFTTEFGKNHSEKEGKLLVVIIQGDVRYWGKVEEAAVKNFLQFLSQ